MAWDASRKSLKTLGPRLISTTKRTTAMIPSITYSDRPDLLVQKK